MTDVRIETPRLLLRHHNLADLDSVAALWADAAVTRFIGGKPQSREESWNRLLRYAGHWHHKGYGYFAVVDRASGAFVGDVGLAEGHRGLGDVDGLPEAGWVLRPSAQGRGFATEAVSAVLDWAASHVDADAVTCLIDVDHAASQRVATRVGFVFKTQADYGGPVGLWQRPLSDSV